MNVRPWRRTHVKTVLPEPTRIPLVNHLDLKNIGVLTLPRTEYDRGLRRICPFLVFRCLENPLGCSSVSYLASLLVWNSMVMRCERVYE